MSENIIFEEKETDNINKNDIDFNKKQENEDLELDHLFRKLEKEDKLSKIFDKLQYFFTNENTSNMNEIQSFSKYLSIEKIRDPKHLFNYLVPNMIFEVIVTRKESNYKILEILVRKFICHSIRKEDFKAQISNDLSNLESKSTTKKYLNHIHQYNLRGYLNFSEIKEDFSVFSYFINFENINEGDILNAILLSKRSGVLEFSLRNNLIFDSLFLSIDEFFDINLSKDNIKKSFYVRLGYTNLIANSQKMVIEQNKNENGEKEKDKKNNNLNKFFEINHQIKSDIVYNNGGIYDLMLSELELDELTTLNYKSNIKFYGQSDISFERIRKYQNKLWAIESLNDGIVLSEHNKYNEAIVCYDHSISLDKSLIDAYVAKGCALANLNNLGESLKEFEKALLLDKEDKNAQIYYEKIKRKKEELDFQEQKNLKEEIVDKILSIGPRKIKQDKEFIFEDNDTREKEKKKKHSKNKK